MIKNYSTKDNVAKITKPAKIKTNWLIPSLLLLVLGVFLFFALRAEFSKLLGLQENRRLLLVSNDQPLALLSFRVDERQLFITDLSAEDFAMGELPNRSRQLVYSFALGVIVDEVQDYFLSDLSRVSLQEFFKNQRPYHLFIKHPSLLLREQRYSGDLPVLSESSFDCPVALINTTAATGLASELAKVLEQSAFLVVKKDSNGDNLTQTKIIYDSEAKACASVLSKLSSFLPFSQLEVNQETTKQARSSIVIYLGEDLVQSLAEKSD